MANQGSPTLDFRVRSHHFPRTLGDRSPSMNPSLSGGGRSQLSDENTECSSVPARRLKPFALTLRGTRFFLSGPRRMLLLPFLIFWARSPMRFSTTNLRILIAGSTAIALLSPLVLSGSLLAADPFERGTAGRTNGQDFQRTGLAGGSGAPGGDRLAAEKSPTAGKTPQRREGTLIPPAAGRVVMIGRRWAFLPASAPAAAAPLPAGTAAGSSGRFAFESFGPGRTTEIADSLTRKPARTSIAPPPATAAGASRWPTQMLISENLMLQRIVEAIRLDPSDDKWTISGEVTEFFDQNRLIIRTAQRSNAN